MSRGINAVSLSTQRNNIYSWKHISFAPLSPTFAFAVSSLPHMLQICPKRTCKINSSKTDALRLLGTQATWENMHKKYTRQMYIEIKDTTGIQGASHHRLHFKNLLHGVASKCCKVTLGLCSHEQRTLKYSSGWCSDGTEVDTNGQRYGEKKTRAAHVSWQQIKHCRTVILRGVNSEEKSCGFSWQ